MKEYLVTWWYVPSAWVVNYCSDVVKAKNKKHAEAIIKLKKPEANIREIYRWYKQ